MRSLLGSFFIGVDSMKEWAKGFYQSGAWRKCRKDYLKSKFGLCERCGKAALIVHHKKYLTPKNINDPNITLNHDNLEALCKECHDKEHEWNKKEKEVLNEGLVFDEDGNILRA